MCAARSIYFLSAHVVCSIFLHVDFSLIAGKKMVLLENEYFITVEDAKIRREDKNGDAKHKIRHD